jgi:hypothetical protein
MRRISPLEESRSGEWEVVLVRGSTELRNGEWFWFVVQRNCGAGDGSGLVVLQRKEAASWVQLPLGGGSEP